MKKELRVRIDAALMKRVKLMAIRLDVSVPAVVQDALDKGLVILKNLPTESGVGK